MSPEGFQGVPGTPGYVLTKFGLKRTHVTLVHTRFHNFLPIWGASGPGPWAPVDTSCRSQLDMDLDRSDLGFDRISIHKMGGSHWTQTSCISQPISQTLRQLHICPRRLYSAVSRPLEAVGSAWVIRKQRLKRNAHFDVM